MAGAALTSLLTAGVLASGLLPTGLPSSKLYVFAAAAAGLSLFGLAARATRRSPHRTLRQLAVANLAYGAAALVLCFLHRATLTSWGALYFAGEAAILVALARLEWRAGAA